MKRIETPIGPGKDRHPWPPEGTLIQLDASYAPSATFILGVVRYAGSLQGLCLRDWNNHWRQDWVLSGNTISTYGAYILEEGDEFYDEASRRYMSLLLVGAAQ